MAHRPRRRRSARRQHPAAPARRRAGLGQHLAGRARPGAVVPARLGPGATGRAVVWPGAAHPRAGPRLAADRAGPAAHLGRRPHRCAAATAAGVAGLGTGR